MECLSHECESQPPPFGRAVSRRTTRTRTTVPSRLMATVCQAHRHQPVRHRNGIGTVSTRACSRSHSCERQTRDTGDARRRGPANGPWSTATSRRSWPRHIAPIELTFDRREADDVSPDKALRCHKDRKVLGAKHLDHPSKQAFEPLGDSDRLGAPAHCRTKDDSPPTGPLDLRPRGPKAWSPYSRVFSDTSREVRYLSTRSAR